MLCREKRASVGVADRYRNQAFQVWIYLHTLVCVCFHWLYNFGETVVLTLLRRSFKNIKDEKKLILGF